MWLEETKWPFPSAGLFFSGTHLIFWQLCKTEYTTVGGEAQQGGHQCVSSD